MFLFQQNMFRNSQENGTNGTERLARDRESEHCSVPIPVPFRPLSVPNSCTAWEASFIRGVNEYAAKWGSPTSKQVAVLEKLTARHARAFAEASPC